ncbi:hypothetical protein QTH25_13440 [Clostridium perfringens]|uniref:hypothetical protein n=1 Tax=Clostridium perfringens TaxID=1502 RepID=UPI00338D441D|nr:hypothetical protein [Clostridium perfringens]
MNTNERAKVLKEICNKNKNGNCYSKCEISDVCHDFPDFVANMSVNKISKYLIEVNKFVEKVESLEVRDEI